MKTAVTLVLALLSLICMVVEAFPSPTSYETFAHQLQQSHYVYVLMDGRGDQRVRNNVYQCGVDFVRSPLFVNKVLIIAAVDNNECVVSINGSQPFSVPVWSCLLKRFSPAYTTIHVFSGHGVKFFDHVMEVGVGERYKEGECAIKVKA